MIDDKLAAKDYISQTNLGDEFEIIDNDFRNERFVGSSGTTKGEYRTARSMGMTSSHSMTRGFDGGTMQGRALSGGFGGGDTRALNSSGNHHAFPQNSPDPQPFPVSQMRRARGDAHDYFPSSSAPGSSLFGRAQNNASLSAGGLSSGNSTQPDSISLDQPNNSFGQSSASGLFGVYSAQPYSISPDQPNNSFGQPSASGLFGAANSSSRGTSLFGGTKQSAAPAFGSPVLHPVAAPFAAQALVSGTGGCRYASRGMVASRNQAALATDRPLGTLAKTNWASKSTAEKVLAVIELEQFDGSWKPSPELNSILNLQRQPGYQETAEWVTMWVVLWLEIKCASEAATFEMVVEKAREWLAGNAFNLEDLEGTVSATMRSL